MPAGLALPPVRRLALVAGVGVLVLALAPAAQAAPVVGFAHLFDLSVGLGRFQDHVNMMARGFWADYARWGETIYVLLFALQFMLIGATMVVKGPFAIASYRPTHFLNPFANFFFFLLAGALGYLFVSHSYWIDASGEHGWVKWLYDVFSEAGERTGCDRGGRVLGMVSACDPDGIAAIGMRISGALLVFSQETGTSSSNPISWLVNAAGASTGVFGAFSVLAIQMTLTQIAFQIAIVTAPLFLATIVFRPLAGISTGYLNFVIYLGVKLFILYIVAGLASFLAAEWLTALVAQILTSLLLGGAGGASAGGIFSFNLSVLTMSMLFLGLTLYLPTRVAQSVSSHLNLDLNAVLFRGELPIAID